MKKIKKILAEIEGAFKPEYALVLTILPYASYYDKESLLVEIRKRAELIKNDFNEINDLVKKSENELDDIYIDKMQQEYGKNIDLKYKIDLSKLQYRMLEDSCRGICLINSLKSKEYVDMAVKEFGTTVTNILQSINTVFINNKKYNENHFIKIKNKEKELLIKYGQNKYDEKVVDYSHLVKFWKKEVEDEDLLKSQVAKTVVEKKINDTLIDSVDDLLTGKTSIIIEKEEIIQNKSLQQDIENNTVKSTTEIEKVIEKNLTIKEIKQALRELAKILAFKKLGEKQSYNENGLNKMYLELEKRFLPEILNLTSKLNDGDQLFKTYVSDTYDKYEIFEKNYGNKDFINPTGFNIPDFFKKVSKGFLLTKNINNENAKQELTKVLNVCLSLIEIKYKNAKFYKEDMNKIISEELDIFETNIKNKRSETLSAAKNKENKYKNITDAYEKIKIKLSVVRTAVITAAVVVKDTVTKTLKRLKP